MFSIIISFLWIIGWSTWFLIQDRRAPPKGIPVSDKKGGDPSDKAHEGPGPSSPGPSSVEPSYRISPDPASSDLDGAVEGDPFPSIRKSSIFKP